MCLMYPSISTRLFQSFRCYEIEKKYYLEVDMAVQCFDSTEHAGYVVVAVIFLALFVVGLPVTIFLQLWRSRAHLHDVTSLRHDHIKHRLGPLYCQYEADKWWFDCCVLTVKMLLAGALTVIAPHSPLQMLVGLVIW